MRVTGRCLALITAYLAATVAPVGAQPVDPYAPLDPAKPAAPATTADGKDLAIAEAVASALVARARELIAADRWADAQQLLGEAVIESPEGLAATEARRLLEEVKRHLGMTDPGSGGPADPYGDIGDPIGDPYVDPNQQRFDPELPPVPATTADGGRKFFWHTAVMGAFVGGFLGDAATADTNLDEFDDESSGPIVAGVLIGTLAGAGVGATFRKNKWLTRADVFTVDSFTAMGLVASLEFTAMLDPVFSEAYSQSGIFGIVGGAITGLVMAKRHDYSVKRMTRVDLFAAGGAALPWLIYAAADGDSDDAQVAGFFSLGGLIGGAWLGFRTTRKMDEPRPSTIADAPGGFVQRDSDGTWHAGGLSLRPVGYRELGPTLGTGGVLDVVGVSF